MKYSILKPTKQMPFNKSVYGFDVETYNKNKSFYCASIWSYKDAFSKTFFKKKDLINYLKLKRFQNSYICATNLGFDFFALFHGSNEMQSFNTLFRGSHLLYAKTYLENKKFIRNYKKGALPLTFIDTMNYASLSVKKFGELLKLPKLNTPEFLGQKPKNKKEKQEMVLYNMRDSEISVKGINFLFDSFQKTGANVKNTIASTSMSLFKNKYLDRDYFRHSVNDLDFQFRGYYGGRTEAFCRGKIEDYYYYDVNSLYPYVMQKFEYPNPNTLRKSANNNIEYIHEYEGMSLVDIFAPYMEFPLLPFRHDKKLLFPTGNFKGCYTHVELRKALELGYIIKKVYCSYYFKENCRPFYRFVKDLYQMRKNNKDTPMDYVIKILMNSLYGKFGQKYRNRDNWLPIPQTVEEIEKLDIYERKGMYIRIKKEFSEPSAFCIPIWASYVTSYARMHLHDLIKRTHPVYCDTDSIMTKKKMLTGDELGKLKLEMKIDEGYIVKPKMYSVKGDRKSFVKVKGLGTKIVWDNFKTDILNEKLMEYTKFAKFKESLRRGLIPNEIFQMSKQFGLEDNKREWESEFNKNELQISKPLNMDSVEKERILLKTKCL